MQTNNVAPLLNLLSLFAAIGLDPADVTTRDDASDALDLADFWSTSTAGTRHHLPDGRVLIHW